MRSKFLVTTAAIFLAGSVMASAQTTTPQEPKGEESSQSAAPNSQTGGSGAGALDVVESDPTPFHGYPQSIEVTLPPLGALVLAPARG